MVTRTQTPRRPAPWPSEKLGGSPEGRMALVDPSEFTRWADDKHHLFPAYLSTRPSLGHGAGNDVWDAEEPPLRLHFRSASRQLGRGVAKQADSGQIPIASVYAAAAEHNSHIESNPNILSGKPCIKGTRIPVALVLRYLAVDDDPVEDLDMTQTDVKDCLKFAARVCDQPTRHAA